MELRRFKLYEIKWDDISRIEQCHEFLVLGDEQEKEPEILNEIRISRVSNQYANVENQLIKREMI